MVTLYTIFMFCWPCISVQFLYITNLTHNFSFVYIYSNSLHVSSTFVLIIRRINLLILILLMWRIGWASNSIPIYIQKDATLHSLFISGNCSTCFGWYFHSSSAAHTTVSTASGICHTVPAICLFRFECAVGGVRHPQHTQTGSNSSTIEADSSNGMTNTRCCRYSYMRFWWWVEVPPETCRAVSKYK
jgi:hypothetical protein